MESGTPWYRSTLALALAGSVLLWAALPPLELAPLAWIAPVPWLVLVRRETLSGSVLQFRNERILGATGSANAPASAKTALAEPVAHEFQSMFSGWRPYLAIYFAALVFWLAAIHWLRLPHPALYVGWFALSAYLACYLPVFVGLSRVAVHRLSVPLWLAAPVVWTGLELARAHLLTGFLMGSIAHTQARWPTVIQIGDLAGEYGVDFVILLVAASLTSTFYPRWRPLALAPGLAMIVAVLVYGNWRLAEAAPGGGANSAPRIRRIALIQGNSLADWKMDSAKQRQIMEEYIGLSKNAVALAKERGAGRPVDLVVWPETMFRSANRTGLVTFEAGYPLPEGVERSTDEITAAPRAELAALVAKLGAPILVGIDRIYFPAAGAPASRDEPPGFQGFNSSVMVSRDSEILGTYDKQHLVMFGEYVPFAKWFPFLNRLSSVTGSVEAGAEPVAFELDDVFYAPNICYETAIPHVIRRQVAMLDAQNRSPDVLVNLTNDAWYWGSSELDMHLACGVFRAVETRRPLVVAANGGISASIDAFGRVCAESPKQQPDVILADVELVPIRSWYVELGDWFAGLCLLACVGLVVVGWWTRGRAASAPAP